MAVVYLYYTYNNYSYINTKSRKSQNNINNSPLGANRDEVHKYFALQNIVRNNHHE